MALVVAGIVETRTVILSASLAPALLAGTVVGMVAFRKLNQRFVRRLTLAIIIFAGTLGIMSGMGLLS